MNILYLLTFRLLILLLFCLLWNNSQHKFKFSKHHLSTFLTTVTAYFIILFSYFKIHKIKKFRCSKLLNINRNK